MNVETVEKKVLGAFQEALQKQGVEVPEVMDKELVLLDSGVDSLGFAILVARLEDELGYDPFSLMETPVYPSTLGEFLDIYARFSEHGREK